MINDGRLMPLPPECWDYDDSLYLLGIRCSFGSGSLDKGQLPMASVYPATKSKAPKSGIDSSTSKRLDFDASTLNGMRLFGVSSWCPWNGGIGTTQILF